MIRNIEGKKKRRRSHSFNGFAIFLIKKIAFFYGLLRNLFVVLSGICIFFSLINCKLPEGKKNKND